MLKDKTTGDFIGEYKGDRCSWTGNYFENIVIDNDSTLNYFTGCNSNNTFDFNIYSLIGQRLEGGCNIRTVKNLEINHSSKKYIYTGKVRECGMCKSLEMEFQLMIVPKIPSDYTVVFEVK
ncbi:MAG: hypothetical protein R2836_04680 [Chitinophagales bacterium]